MKVYYGCDIENDRIVYATVTGQMDDGTMVYTECETENGAVVYENGYPKLLLDRQYTRRLRHGMQTFHRL